jgi:hypothetical protein
MPVKLKSHRWWNAGAELFVTSCVYECVLMKFSPFRVSFDEPLGRREHVRSRMGVAVLGIGLLLVGSLGGSWLLKAGSSAIAEWTNARLDDRATVGLAPRVESGAADQRVNSGPNIASGPKSTAAEAAAIAGVDEAATPKVQQPAAKAVAKQKTPVRAKRQVQQKSRPASAFSGAEADARTEALWRERAANIGRNPPRSDFTPRFQ